MRFARTPCPALSASWVDGPWLRCHREEGVAAEGAAAATLLAAAEMGASPEATAAATAAVIDAAVEESSSKETASELSEEPAALGDPAPSSSHMMAEPVAAEGAGVGGASEAAQPHAVGAFAPEVAVKPVAAGAATDVSGIAAGSPGHHPGSPFTAVTVGPDAAGLRGLPDCI